MAGLAACPTADAGMLGISNALGAVDCNVGLLVTSSYGRLFGTEGVFGTVLTGLLTLYVGFVALGLMTGRTRLTLSGMVPKVLAIGLVLTFATSWPAYHALVFGLLVGGPEQLATALAGANGDTLGFANRLDLLLDAFATLAKVIGDNVPSSDAKALGPLAGPQIASALVWLSGMMILLASAGALVLTRIVLALLLAIGPVFIVFGLFRQTRGLLEAWLRTSLLFALAPTLTVLAGSAALTLLTPLVDIIAQDPAGAVADLRPIIELFLGSIVYVGLVAMLMWASASLVRGWRFGRSEEEPASFDQVHQAGLPPTTLHGTASASAATLATDARVNGIVVALSRAGRDDMAVQTASIRVEQVAANGSNPISAPGTGSPAGTQRRTEGLAQGLRAARRPHFAGVVQ